MPHTLRPVSMQGHAAQWTLIALFCISGLSGLIYESIWAQYLKLLLGHAAYAQTLVLTIFMGGMAIGSWLVGRRTATIRNLLLGYALIEGLIGLAGIGFHSIFNSTMGFAHDAVLPALGQTSTSAIVKWGFAAALIAPQSILLGTTFPLMSGALIRRFPQAPGKSVATLYFANSLGAAIGAIASGFVLIPISGLPGTLLTAGSINIVLAVVVYLLAKSPGWVKVSPPASLASAPEKTRQLAPPWLLLTVALLTGTASFIYEIGWLRMLSMVLGSSTHAFELMLSAFLLGLALGSLWIRGRIQRLRSPIAFLGAVQCVMGALAIGTLLVYGFAFDWMSALMQGLNRTESGYVLFNVASHTIAVAIMVPVTVCAGMTLPLITYSLLSTGFGERSIAHVYAVNTIGSIAGILLAVHIGLPQLGLKNTILFGASIDILLGAALLSSLPGVVAGRIAGAFAVVILTASLLFVQLDQRRMASGVFRYGSLEYIHNSIVQYHSDGKTATVHVTSRGQGIHTIKTNGKPDSALQLNPVTDPQRSLDEYNMALVSVLPLATNRQARRVAVIGFGSGLSTHVMLADPAITRVDTIEIEPRMVEASRLFHRRVYRSFDDPRSHIHFDDARTFFATQREPYDLIVSEPSTPWVSGVASLYTEEFYSQIKRNLASNGLFTQWLHGSELSMELTSLVARTLGKVFDDYAMFNLNGYDMAFVASVGDTVDTDPTWPFRVAAIARELALLNLKSPRDIRIRYLGSKSLLGPWFRSYGNGVNSDYFPVLDLGAVQARFEHSFATEVFALRRLALPVVEMLSPPWISVRETDVTATQEFEFATVLADAEGFARTLLDRPDAGAPVLKATARERVAVTGLALASCGEGVNAALWWRETAYIADTVLPHLPVADARAVTDLIRQGCHGLSNAQSAWLSVLSAVAARDAEAMSANARHLLTVDPPELEPHRGYLLSAAMLGDLAEGKPHAALRAWKTHGDARAPQPLSQELRLLVSYTLENTNQ